MSQSAGSSGSIVAEELVKTFNGSVHAVRGVSFAVQPGEVYGFLGPNGAGKTTTVSILTAGLEATAGKAASTVSMSAGSHRRSSGGSGSSSRSRRRTAT